MLDVVDVVDVDIFLFYFCLDDVITEQYCTSTPRVPVSRAAVLRSCGVQQTWSTEYKTISTLGDLVILYFVDFGFKIWCSTMPDT